MGLQMDLIPGIFNPMTTGVIHRVNLGVPSYLQLGISTPYCLKKLVVQSSAFQLAKIQALKARS